MRKEGPVPTARRRDARDEGSLLAVWALGFISSHDGGCEYQPRSRLLLVLVAAKAFPVSVGEGRGFVARCKREDMSPPFRDRSRDCGRGGLVGRVRRPGLTSLAPGQR